MTHLKHYYLLAVCMAMSGCAMHTNVQVITRFPALRPYGDFAVFKEDEPFDIQSPPIGDIRIEDVTFTLDCGFEQVVQLAQKEAMAIGANCIRIYEHKLPDQWSTCHRIKAKAYRLDNVTPYMKSVIWHKMRPLKIEDFKGGIDERPFQAATASHFTYKYSGRRYQGNVKFEVSTVFDCQMSYFKPSAGNQEILTHEQGHFDITEIYARRFLKAVRERIANTRELEKEVQNIYRQIALECNVEQDKYDSDVYQDRAKQAAWSLKIQSDLESLKDFEQKEIGVKF